MLSICGGIFLIVILVTIHEMGHLLVARKFGVGVESFSVGFGPGFKMFTARGIPFYFRCILLGGYAKLKSRGLGDAAKSQGKFLEDIVWWQKILVFFGGVGFNLATAIILRTLMFFLPRPIPKPR